MIFPTFLIKLSRKRKQSKLFFHNLQRISLESPITLSSKLQSFFSAKTFFLQIIEWCQDLLQAVVEFHSCIGDYLPSKTAYFWKEAVVTHFRQACAIGLRFIRISSSLHTCASIDDAGRLSAKIQGFLLPHLLSRPICFNNVTSSKLIPRCGYF